MTTTPEPTTGITLTGEEYAAYQAQQTKLREAQAQLTDYRNLLIRMAREAIDNGADVDRVGEALTDLGVSPTILPAVIRARYAITGHLEFVLSNGTYAEQHETLRGFMESNAKGSSYGRRELTMVPDSVEWFVNGEWISDAEYQKRRAGTANAVTPVNDIAELKSRARKWALALARETGWGFCSTFRHRFHSLDAGPLPPVQPMPAGAPIRATGTFRLRLSTFEGDTPEEVQASIHAWLRRPNRHVALDNVEIFDVLTDEAPAGS